MERELPIYFIEGIPFVVDVEYNLLRHANDNENFFKFSDLINQEVHYLLYFDREQQTAELYDTSNPNLVVVKIPQMVQLDPEGVALKYNLKISELPEQDSALVSDHAFWDQRKNGTLPIISICDNVYFINIRLGILEPENIMADTIQLDDLERDKTNTFYYFMYDQKKQMVIPFDEKRNKLPADVVILKVPHARILDPFAIRAGSLSFENRIDRIGEFPVRCSFTARVIPPKDYKQLDLINRHFTPDRYSIKNRKGARIR